MDQIKDLICQSLNWEKILDSAFSHGIAPLLYQNLKNIPESHLIPQDVMDKLKKAYHGNVARNMFLYEELKRILEEFQETGVEAILLKGAALAKAVYRDIGLRPMVDIDLLVKQRDLTHVKKIMSDLRYVHTADSTSEKWYEENHHHLPLYIHPEKSVVVEVHRNISGHSFHINIEEWWERITLVRIGNFQVRIPSPEDMVMHLCIHLFNHGYNEMTLRGICDIFETLKYYKKEIDWKLFQDEINKYKINKPVYTMLYLVKEFIGNNDDLLNWINPKFVDFKLLALIEKRILSEAVVNSAVPKQLVQSLALDNFWDKAKILFSVIFTTREKMAKRYAVSFSSKKIYFYYFIRPFYLLLKYGEILLEIFRLKKYSVRG